MPPHRRRRPLDHADRSGPSRQMQVRAEQTAVVYRNAPLGTSAAMVAGLLLAALVTTQDGAMLGAATIWWCLLAAIFLAHLALLLAYRRARPAAARWRHWSLLFGIAVFLEGLDWGAGALVLMRTGGLERELSVMLVVAVISAGSAVAYGPLFPVFIAFMLPSIIPYLGYCLVLGDPVHLVLAALSFWFATGFAAVGLGNSRAFGESIGLRFDNAALAEDLRAQTARAEAANVAKSRFLAAASHDLRQPVHALGLFAGALHWREMDAEARQILTQVETSIAALDGLFAALLDISKIDAGIVELHPAAFAVQPMLARIVAEQQAAARAKGLSLKLVPCSLAVESDPVLLERILRNMLANAIRFTKSGGIVVGCRRGARLRIEVADTGPGIAPQERERIFEEFHQLGNPERDRGEGLGLGLAIVRRLAALLACEVSLRSQQGKGSVFAIAVPRAAAAAPGAIAAPAGTGAGAGLVLVIDDEAMVREGTGAMLKSWGFDTLAAGSAAEMLEKIDHCYTVPCLIICDFRLRGGRSGIDALRELQEQYETEIPGILVTGDTAPERIRESRDSGFALLHKPVAPARLRAAIDAALAGRDAIAPRKSATPPPPAAG